MELTIGNGKVAVIGAGYWGKNLIRNFSQLGALGCIVDSSPVIQERMTQEYPGVKLTASFSDVLGDADIRGVAIATPAETHGVLVREAILAGKDVYVEKPLCLSESEGKDLIRLAEDRGTLLMVGHLLWYHPVLLKLQELLRQGELGRIRYIYSNRLNMGKLRAEENVLWSFAPHDISVILGLLEEMPESVNAQGGNYLHQNIADVTVTLLSFASGIKAHIFVSWLHPFKEQKLVVVGDRQMAVFDDTAPWGQKLVLYPHQVEWRNNVPTAVKAAGEAVAVEQEEPLRAECAHFLDCMVTRKPPRTDGAEGLRVLKVLNACQHALETGKIQTMDRKQEEKFFAHPSAVVDRNVEIGAGTRIWHFSHILEGSTIGEGCNIGQNVVIGPHGRIGKGCKIQNNVSLYEGVILEDHVFCGPSMVFTNVYNPRAAIKKMDQLRRTLVGRGATFGANCTIVCGNTIGEYAFIGAGAVVNRSVKPYALVVGNPAKQIGWVCRCGEKLPQGQGEVSCSSCDATYLVEEDDCLPKA
ncbi:MAG: Gfo/Idh/MocA family oxidoreductase [Magnetococcales bacterium]|nr:Gfo/Idh/MocA family oxidoreductase [Magnetococcales bacterium]